MVPGVMVSEVQVHRGEVEASGRAPSSASHEQRDGETIFFSGVLRRYCVTVSVPRSHTRYFSLSKNHFIIIPLKLP